MTYSLSRIFWAVVMLLRARGRLRSAVDATRDYEEALRNDRAMLEYYLAEQPTRRMDLIMAQVEFDLALGRHRETAPKRT